jgi:FAD/FMN-containing dehydrogenase
MKRRHFLKAAGVLALSAGNVESVLARRGATLNDVHSMLNATEVDDVVRPSSVDELRAVLKRAARERRPISVAGGRHAMGGQQFAARSIHVDTRGLDRVRGLDRERGLMEVEAGIQWPALIGHYLEAQGDAAGIWSIAQKQTGADRFTLGGTLAANAHGRVLTRKPIIAEVESFELMDADGEVRTCSRTENPELFALVIGGYGLFGIVTSVTLRMVRREKIERVVEILTADRLMPSFEERIRDGFTYGDFQFSTDDASEDFIHRGVFSCYRPVESDRPMPETQRRLRDEDWQELLHLAHADKRAGFAKYSSYYLSTSGQLYWSDTHQYSTYLDDYHTALDRRLGARRRGSEMITEIDVPRSRLVDFFAEVREDFRRYRVPLIYGTVRLIETDDESFLPWAREPYVCTIFNLHVEHSRGGTQEAAQAFRRLIDMAVRRGGSYYLTYHRWADRSQVVACYPRFEEFLKLKGRYDPAERFQSEWWRHYRRMFRIA